MEALERLRELYIRKPANEIPYEVVNAPEKGDEVELGKDIKGTIVHKDSFCTIYMCTMKKGSQLEEHSHNCREIVLVLCGHLYDEVSKVRLANGSKQVIIPNIPHKHVALEDSRFIVTFYNPEFHNLAV